MRALFLLSGIALAAQTPPASVHIEKQDSGYVLMRDGRPYFIRGAGGSGHLDELAAAGGNSLRVWSPPAGSVLDMAQQHGLSVMVGLSVGKPRQGFDYGNAQQVEEQRRQVVDTVHRLKGNP